MLATAEEMYKFSHFASPLLEEGDFDAKPMVLLLGQYSVGKTSFIQYLLERDFPGIRIGPEPTTDRFVAVMYGDEDRVTPGNAAAIQAELPFRGLQKFGTGLLNKFEVSQADSRILRSITFVDTPGVLSGEKQRLGRSYEFTDVVECVTAPRRWAPCAPASRAARAPAGGSRSARTSSCCSSTPTSSTSATSSGGPSRRCTGTTTRSAWC